MGLFAGIVGLPNVGKSTLFNTVTNSNVLAINYRFATIEPNFGLVDVYDERLQKLQKIYSSKKIIPASFKFVDIAGLIEGASKGEGLGNQFLQNIRDVDAICHVVRCFIDNNVVHEYEKIDPIRDAQIINLELSIADLEVVEKRIIKIKKKADSGDKESIIEVQILNKLKDILSQGKFAKFANLSIDELKIIRFLNLITLKPMIYIANVSDDDISNPEQNLYFKSFKEFADKENNEVVPISIKIEHELSILDEDSKKIFMNDLNITQTGLEKVTNATFKLLNLSTYFTCGEQEIHAWVFSNGMLAPQCAGIIHSDFEKGFIKAEVISYDDLINCGNELKAKEMGKMRLEGKSYLMQDGDICNFKFNVTK
ncbi:MAG: redox-regulated ATPase YchF [Ureaplasma sp.]|nr:redox-regulated ATPase YchF [Ureaplasma sp.]MDE7221918.1 redox-regulated ATPase YchF [Ureaplasma sp.]